MDKKILIVDDESSIRTLLDRAFSRAGFTPVTAESAEEALDILEKETIQVMFIDLKLPGMNGIEFCREVQKINPIAARFAMTGYSSVFELAESRDAGFDDYFLKPINLEVFLKTAEDAFKKLDRWKRRKQ